MKQVVTKVIAGLMAVSVLSSISSRAALITVDEVDVTPYQCPLISGPNIGTIRAEAGIIKLRVDGVEMDGFCIDPFNLSLSTSPGYQYIALQDGPKAGQMGTEVATLISRLWGSYYSPTMSASDAAGLQIAIWKLTGRDAFKLLSNDDFGAADFLKNVSRPNYSGPVANLIGLTGPGQDYVVQNVPDAGSTLVFLGLTLCGLYAARKLPLA